MGRDVHKILLTILEVAVLRSLAPLLSLSRRCHYALRPCALLQAIQAGVQRVQKRGVCVDSDSEFAPTYAVRRSIKP